MAVNSDLREVASLQKLTIAGHIDKFTADRDIVLEGWGRLSSGDGNGGMIRLDTDLPVVRVEMQTMARPDVVNTVGDPGLAFSGFRIRLVLEPAECRRDIRSASARTIRFTDSSACTTTRRCPARLSVSVNRVSMNYDGETVMQAEPWLDRRAQARSALAEETPIRRAR